MAKVNGRLIDLIRKDEPIIKYEGEGAQILRQTSKPLSKIGDEMPELIERMEAIMHEARGIGLAAPQLGIMKRIFIYDIGDGLQAIINPKILQHKGEQIGEEGCLSLPGLRGDVNRFDEVVVKGVDQFGTPVRVRGTGLTARVIQHEFDHLDGILFIDRADPDTLHMMTAKELEDDEEAGTDTESTRE